MQISLPARPAPLGTIVIVGTIASLLGALYSTLLIATLEPRIGREVWLEWVEIGTVLLRDSAIKIEPGWREFAAGLVVHNGADFLYGLGFFVLLSRWTWRFGPRLLLLSWPVWALATAWLEYYVILPIIGETLQMQVPFWTSIFGHLSTTIVYPAFPWLRAHLTGQPVAGYRFARASAYALGVLGLAAITTFGAAVSRGELPGPIGPAAYDRTFLHHMTNHHDVGMYMARLVSDRGENPDVRTLGRLMVYEQFRQNVLMRRWWRAWFDSELPSMPPGEWSTMPGMPTPAELNELEGLSGTALDRRFLELMIPHHDGGVQMARRAQLEASDPRIWILAATIRHPQRTQIARMRELSGRIR